MAKVFNGCPATKLVDDERIECTKVSHSHLEHVGYVVRHGVNLRITWNDDWREMTHVSTMARP